MKVDDLFAVESPHGPFRVELSTDGGVNFVQLDDGFMTQSQSTGGPPGGPWPGPDVFSLPSTYKTTIMADGQNDVVFRFAQYASGVTPGGQLWGLNAFILVPDPATLTLLGAAACCLGIRRRRKA